MQTCFSLPSVLLTTATEPRWLVMHDTMLVVTQDLVIRAPSKLHPSGSNGNDRCTPSWYQHNTSNTIRGHTLWKPTTIQTSLVIYILHEPMLFMSCLLTYRFQCQLLFHTDTAIHNVLPYSHSRHSYFAMLHSQEFFFVALPHYLLCYHVSFLML